MKFKTLPLVFILTLSLFSCKINDIESDSDKPNNTAEITILYTNDIHGYIDNSYEVNNETLNTIRFSDVAGYKTYISEKEERETLLVDAGDHLQGTLYTSFDEGKSMIKLMKSTGYDILTIGNHEFDYGFEPLKERISEASDLGLEYVSSNLYNIESETKTTTLVKPYTIKELDGVKIAFIGATTPDSLTTTRPTNFYDKEGNLACDFSKNDEMVKDFQKSIDSAKEDGADICIGLVHLGEALSPTDNTSTYLIENTKGLSAVIDGHTHSEIEKEVVKDLDNNEVILTQTGSYLNNIGRLDITYNINLDKLENLDTTLLDQTEIDSSLKNETVKNEEEKLISNIESLFDQKVCETDIDFTVNNPEDSSDRIVREIETNLADLVADSYYYYANEYAVDTDIALINGGGVRVSISNGDIKMKDIKSVTPFDNVLAVVKTSGKSILDALEFGATLTTGNTTEDAENGSFMHVAGLSYKINYSIASTVTTDSDGNFTGVSGDYRCYDVMVYNKETSTYEELDLDKEYTVAGVNYFLTQGGSGFTMFSSSTLLLEGLSADYLAVITYLESFTDTDSNNYANISTTTSPLYSLSNYLINYENPYGAGRIIVSDKEE